MTFYEEIFRGFQMKITDKKIRENWIKNKYLKDINFYKKDKLKEVYIIIESPVSFEQARKTVMFIKVDNLRLPIISIDNLIKMKRKLGRTIDKLAIEELKK